MSKLTLSFKGKLLKIIPLHEGELVIGSDPECGIHIDSLALQARHARVVTHGDETTVEDLGTPDGTFLNNEKLEQSQALKDEDVVRVGKHTLTYVHEEEVGEATPTPAEQPPQDSPAPGGEQRARAAWLQILNGQNLGKTINLNRRMTNLGKPGVQTAVIAHRNEGYFLSHLEGEHPPKVDGVSIGDRSWPLEDGQVIQIGNVRMQFYLE